MTAALEQFQSSAELRRLIERAQAGEEIIITSQGKIVARLTGVAATEKTSKPDYTQWLAELAKLRESLATGKTVPTTEQILNDIRSDRT